MDGRTATECTTMGQQQSEQVRDDEHGLGMVTEGFQVLGSEISTRACPIGSVCQPLRGISNVKVD